MIRTIKRYPIATFFSLAFVLTWAVWVPRAAVSQGLLASDLPVVLGQVWTWAPAVAAVLAAVLTGGRAALGELGARLVRWRVGWTWYVVVIVGPAAFSLAVAGVYALLGGSWSSATPPALHGGSLVLLPLLLLILALTDGLGEELGWRGFALPRLLARHGAIAASLIVGVLWALWHLPLLWTEGASIYQQPVWLLLVDVPAKSVIFTWVFLHTRGSVLLAVLLHAATNLFVVSPTLTDAGDPTLPIIAAAAKWTLVLVVMLVAGPGLARDPRPETPSPRSRGK
ncbi:MAG: CPBP family glutamic-type intramembrane protease [Rubrobacter sp.]